MVMTNDDNGDDEDDCSNDWLSRLRLYKNKR